MSIALMTAAWRMTMPNGRKMVLLALCDAANDEGRCYPSITTIMTKCSMGERTVQQHIAKLESDCVLKRELRAGRSTIYHLDPRIICTPADSAPPQKPQQAPADSAPPPPQNLHPTPAKLAPITVKEPSKEPSRKRQGARGTRLSPEWVLTFGYAKAAAEINPAWTEDEIRLIGQKFRDHWIAATGNKACKADWLATWRNWCRNEMQMGFGSKNKGVSNWRASDEASIAKGKELNLIPRVGESMYSFRLRIDAALDNGGKEPTAQMTRLPQEVPGSDPAIKEAQMQVMRSVTKARRK